MTSTSAFGLGESLRRIITNSILPSLPTNCIYIDSFPSLPPSLLPCLHFPFVSFVSSAVFQLYCISLFYVSLSLSRLTVRSSLKSFGEWSCSNTFGLHVHSPCVFSSFFSEYRWFWWYKIHQNGKHWRWSRGTRSLSLALSLAYPPSPFSMCVCVCVSQCVSFFLRACSRLVNSLFSSSVCIFFICKILSLAQHLCFLLLSDLLWV